MMIVMMLMVSVVIMMEAKTCSVHREDGLRHFANDEVPVSQVGEHLNSQWFLKTRFSKARFSKTRFSMVFKAKWKNTLFLSKLTILPKQCL